MTELVQLVLLAHASPAGGTTVAVFTTLPVAAAVIDACTVTTADALPATLHTADTAPVPLTGEQPGADQFVNVTPLGAVSLTCTPVEADVLVLLTVNV